MNLPFWATRIQSLAAIDFAYQLETMLYDESFHESSRKLEDEMEQEYRKTETSQEVTPAEPVQNAVRTETYQEVAKAEPVKSFPVVKIVYFILGVLEIFLGLRLILRLLGASPDNVFVPFIYNVTWIFVAPFSGIFSTAVTQGAETEAVLEPGTIIAMLIYALLAWGIVKLIIIIRNKKPAGYRNN